MRVAVPSPAPVAGTNAHFLHRRTELRVARAQDAAAPVIFCPSVRVPPAAEQKESMQRDGPEGRTQVLSSSTRWKGVPHTCPLRAGPARRGGGGEGGTRGVLTHGPGNATLAQARVTSKFIPICGLSSIYHTPALIIREKDTPARSEGRLVKVKVKCRPSRTPVLVLRR